MILYQVSFLQYRLKRLNEAFTNADIIIADAKSNEVQIRFPKNDESEQEVALRTAAKRLKAMIYEKQGNVLEATKIYNDILLNGCFAIKFTQWIVCKINLINF